MSDLKDPDLEQPSTDPHGQYKHGHSAMAHRDGKVGVQAIHDASKAVWNVPERLLRAQA